MKYAILLFASSLLLFLQTDLNAQTFTVADTVVCYISTTQPCNSPITNTTSSPMKLKWHVVGTTFTPAMLVDSVFGICDNNLCRPNTSGILWNGSSGSAFTTIAYSPGSPGGFDYSPNLTHVTDTGCHTLTVNIEDTSTGYNKNTTFIICKAALGITNVNTASMNEVFLYPNPANDELNVVYNASADVKNIAVYNIIGKVMSVYKVNGDSANLNLENIPSGIYFVRLVNSHGDVVVTRKFTKQ